LVSAIYLLSTEGNSWFADLVFETLVEAALVGGSFALRIDKAAGGWLVGRAESRTTGPHGGAHCPGPLITAHVLASPILLRCFAKVLASGFNTELSLTSGGSAVELKCWVIGSSCAPYTSLSESSLLAESSLMAKSSLLAETLLTVSSLSQKTLLTETLLTTETALLTETLVTTEAALLTETSLASYSARGERYVGKVLAHVARLLEGSVCTKVRSVSLVRPVGSPAVAVPSVRLIGHHHGHQH